MESRKLAGKMDIYPAEKGKGRKRKQAEKGNRLA